ncbi:hypothetical protein GCM10008927_12030 [Amylibacter ulvae]|uniref:Glycosyltransferase 2-like domain-containing protein n=1 Tax=Paramylibacter ulvae TaxID=1651968 RepID=A0ABQ3CYN4_9RHOB|nr:glycosyltransferase family 2 protein [Amylibacter ulvae]GHA48538.1 hypothetical protein GCM10008927_12030 [Amylibacter ulvae]
MNFAPPASVIIVSHGRPDGLARVLAALRFQTYHNFEIVVVADHDPALKNVKFIHFGDANISTARNLGISHAVGDVIVFCDDDAIPEPRWLERLIAPFENPDVGVAGGYVRGRNGISFQWRALATDMNGNDHTLDRADDTSVSIHTYDKRFAKVQGTNCAFRTSALIDLGGFDENFAFYLDETELTLRMGRAGWNTAVVPLAEVQHGYAASGTRGANRAPKSLFQIGFSKTYFLRQYGDLATLQAFRDEQGQRLSAFVSGTKITSAQRDALLQSLDQGMAQGAQVIDPKCNLSLQKQRKFKPAFSDVEPQGVAIVGSLLRWNKMVKRAERMAAHGIPTTVFCFTHTTLFHRRYFDARGFWVQTGGVYGRSDRTDPIFHPYTTGSRAKREQVLLSDQRDFSKILDSSRG